MNRGPLVQLRAGIPRKKPLVRAARTDLGNLGDFSLGFVHRPELFSPVKAGVSLSTGRHGAGAFSLRTQYIGAESWEAPHSPVSLPQGGREIRREQDVPKQPGHSVWAHPDPAGLGERRLDVLPR